MRVHRLISRGLFCLSLGFTLAACGGAGENSETSIANESAPLPICGLTPTCDTPAPIGQAEGFQGKAPKGDAFHFGKDFYFNESNLLNGQRPQ
ncbi:MAG: hypothetical protein EOP10_19115 [Proteobacteria bacterium]|nr:MAG: hypothetical protein EOP10_19115 [Pseudomonadota bacterium]